MFSLHPFMHQRSASHHKVNHHLDMLNGKLLSKILWFALPLSLSCILQQVFNSVDIAVLGQFSSTEAMAAVGCNGPIINLLITLFVGISVGTNVVIARYVGQKDDHKIRLTVKTSQLVAIAGGIFLMILGFFVARPMLEAIDTPDEVLDMATAYLQIYFAGMPAFLFFNFGAAILRSVGDTRRPLLSLVVSGIVNAVLNIILVVGFDLGVEGVAIATVISNFICAGMVAHWLARESGAIRWTFRDLELDRESLVQIMQIGVPAGLQGMVFSFSNVFIQSAINSHGTAAAAGSAAALIFECIAWLAVSGFSQAAVTFTSQNYGAHQFERCKRVLVLCSLCAVGMCAVWTVLFVGGRSLFIELFTSDPEVARFAALRIVWVLTLEPIAVAYELPGAAMRGLGYSMTPTVITILGTCVFRLCWIYGVCPSYPSFEALMVVYPISWFITGVATMIAYSIIRRRVYRVSPPEMPILSTDKCLA